jgi:hypothetical protein
VERTLGGTYYSALIHSCPLGELQLILVPASVITGAVARVLVEVGFYIGRPAEEMLVNCCSRTGHFAGCNRWFLMGWRGFGVGASDSDSDISSHGEGIELQD